MMCGRTSFLTDTEMRVTMIYVCSILILLLYNGNDVYYYSFQYYASCRLSRLFIVTVDLQNKTMVPTNMYDDVSKTDQKNKYNNNRKLH